jgi:hypothetical protein
MEMGDDVAVMWQPVRGAMKQRQTERLGVAALDYFFSDLGWMFREQAVLDYGIDAHVEIVENERPTGMLIALQIKSGSSFFKEETDEAYVFRSGDKHIAYWIGHSMPVVVVLYNPDTKQAFWQHINEDSVERTGKAWKLAVPKSDMLVEVDKTRAALMRLTQPEPYLRLLNRLRVDRQWMEKLANGQQVRIQFDDWVNKSLPRYQITLSSDHQEEAWPAVYSPGVGVEAMLEYYFPWANIALDRDAHAEGARDRWAAECYSNKDSETGQIFYSSSFEEWYDEPQEDIVPVFQDGETVTYSFLLSLNELGLAFLLLDDYLADPDVPEAIGFKLE